MYVKKKRAKQEKERTNRLHTTIWRVYKMQKRNIIAITFYGVLLLSITYLLVGQQGINLLIALFR